MNPTAGHKQRWKFRKAGGKEVAWPYKGESPRHTQAHF